MTRPIDWSPLAGSDPVPGDPELVRELARRYKRTAEAIATAADNLRTIAGGQAGWTGKAGPEIQDACRGVGDTVAKAQARYDEAADALAAYAQPLEDAQRDADRALRDAKDAETDLTRARAQARSVEDPAGVGKDEATRHQHSIDSAGSALSSARALMDRAVQARDSAAEKAASALHTAAEHQHDSFWDKMAKVLAKIADVAGVVATICGVLSLLVGWIPVIGQALAAILGTVALIASAIALVCHLALLIGGKGSLTDVIMDVISVASFGIGRAFSSAAKLSSVAARSKAWTAANNIVRANSPALNSAGRRLQVVAMVGLRRGASAAAAGRGPAGLLRGTGGLRAASGGLPTEIAAAVRGAWRGRAGTPGWSGSPVTRVTEFTAAIRTEFGTAFRSNGVRGVVDVIYGAKDVGRELGYLRAISDNATRSAITRQLVAEPDVSRAVRLAVRQNRIRVGAVLTGSAADFYSGFNSIKDATASSPDVTGTPAPVGASR